MKKTFLIFLSISLSIFAISTEFFTSEKKDFYDNGRPDNISIDQNNKITLAKRLKEIPGVSETYLWDLSFSENGTLYIATGHGGRVYSYKNDTINDFYTIDNLEASAVLARKNGSVLIAGIPQAMLYEVNSEGEGKILKLFEDSYIWDMVEDNEGNVFIACGGKYAALYKMDSTGKIERYLEMDENHIATLFYDKENDKLYAGTEGKGLLIKITGKYKYEVLYDTAEREVHAIEKNSMGEIFFATASREKSYSSKEKSDKNRKPLKNALYKYDKRGVVTRLFFFSESVVLDLICDDKDLLYIATGDDGELFMLDEKGIISRISKMNENQIISFAKNKEGEIFLGSGTRGYLYKLDINYANEGEFKSEVMDARLLSKWGSIRFDGKTPSKTKIRFQTRSGNIEYPDSTWSEFEDVENGKILSPHARFIQYKIIMETENKTISPEIESFRLSYIPYNGAPEVFNIDLTTYHNQKRLKQNGKKPSLNNGEALLSWDSYDPNGDELLFNVYYKWKNESEWKLLKEDYRYPYYVIDMKRYPSQTYTFKISATDRRNNMQGKEFTVSTESKPFKMDVQAPLVKSFLYEKGNENIKSSFSVFDELSVISSVRYSLNGKDWQYINPLDEIYDSETESFELNIPLSAKSVSFEVIDTENNRAYYPFIIE